MSERIDNQKFVGKFPSKPKFKLNFKRLKQKFVSRIADGKSQFWTFFSLNLLMNEFLKT